MTLFKNQTVKIKYDLLPRDEYPNGAYWYANSDSIKNVAKLVHFNYVVGDVKIKKMKKYNMWFPDK